jgi:hypothetical protein
MSLVLNGTTGISGTNALTGVTGVNSGQLAGSRNKIINGIDAWKVKIKAVKDATPKTINRSTER